MPLPSHSGQPRNPTLFEVNTRLWLREMPAPGDRPPTLDLVPDTVLDRLAELGFQWLWLMGVWQSGDAGRQLSLSQDAALEEFRRLLPDFTEPDVCCSPFAIQRYQV